MADKIGFTTRILTSTIVLYLMVQVHTAQAAIWYVADEKGWQWDAEGWPKGKTFKTGDILVFRYEVGMHTVGITNKDGYDYCETKSIIRELNTGNDAVHLVRGDNYFICGTMGHCGARMRMKITAI